MYSDSAVELYFILFEERGIFLEWEHLMEYM